MRNHLYQNIFIISLYLSYLLFAISISGVYKISPLYIINLRSFMRYYVCIFLIIRFNPFTNIRKITKEDIQFDRKIAFTAGVFLFLSTSLFDIALNYTNVDIITNI
jgi:hypothetical protein